jgi:putative DNA-invertase from lambdoid prophage Rac
LRAALYARVSTDKCDLCGKNLAFHARVLTHQFKGQDPERQLREMREYCLSRKWKAMEFVDRVSGAKVQRPELDRMWSLCRRRRFDVIVVQDLDRLGRTVKHLVTALDELNTWGVQFVALKRGFDTTTAQGRLMFHIIASFAEFEREMIRERVISALETARLPIAMGGKGKTLGRPRCNPDVARIRDLRASGETWERVAHLVGVSRATAKRAVLAAQKPASDAVQ